MMQNYKKQNQQLFTHNTNYAIQKLQLKLKFLNEENQRLKSQLSQNQSKNIKFLIELLTGYLNNKQTQDASTYDKDISEANKKQSDIIYSLKQQLLKTYSNYQQEQKLRLKAEAQLLLTKQIFLEERQLIKELIASYQQKIFELRRLVQDKQCLIQLKSEYYEQNKQNLKFMKKYKQNMQHIQDEMIYLKCMNNLQKQLSSEKQSKQILERQLKSLQSKIIVIDQILKLKFNIPLQQFISRNQKELTTNVIDSNQILINLDDNNSNKQEDIIFPENSEIKYKGCCGDFIAVIKKNAVLQKILIQEIQILKKIISDLKNGYMSLVNAYKTSQQKQKELMLKTNLYKYGLLMNKRNLNLLINDLNNDECKKKQNLNIQTRLQFVDLLKKNPIKLQFYMKKLNQHKKNNNKKLRSFSCFNKLKQNVNKILKQEIKPRLRSTKTQLPPFLTQNSQISNINIQQSSLKSYFRQQI